MKRLVYLIVIISVLSFGCGKEDDGPQPQSSPVAVNTGPIDPKSLLDTKSVSILLFDEIAGQLPHRGVPIVVKTPSFAVRGWAIDQQTKSPAGGVIVSVAGKDFVADYGAPRPDVADNLKSANYVNSGFKVSIDSAAIGKGKHTLTFRVVTSDRKSYYQQPDSYEVIVE